MIESLIMNGKYIYLDGSVMLAGDGRVLFLFVYLRLGVTNIISLYFPSLKNNILTNYKIEEFSA